MNNYSKGHGIGSTPRYNTKTLYSNYNNNNNNNHIFPLPIFISMYNGPLSRSNRVRNRQIFNNLVCKAANSLIFSLHSLYYSVPLSRVMSTRHLLLSFNNMIDCVSSKQYRLLYYIYMSTKRMIVRGAAPTANRDNALVSPIDPHIYTPFVKSASSSLSRASLPNIDAVAASYGDYSYEIMYSVLTNLFCSSISYRLPTVPVPIIASRVSLPSLPSRVSFLPLLPDNTSKLYASSSELLLPIPPTRSSPFYMGVNRTEYIALINRMVTAGMIKFTSTPKVVNGLFGVDKPDDSIRLIVDARPANSVFIPSPPVVLPSPTAFTHLYTDGQKPIYVAKIDLDNYYHQLLLPEWLCPYFCLPPVPICQLHDVSLDATIINNCNENNHGMIYPMVCTLPMGFSHSVYIGQSMHEHMIYSSGVLSPNDRVFDTPTSHRHFDTAGTLHSIYIDDVVLMDTDAERLTDTIHKLLDMYKSNGIVVKMSKLVWPSCTGVEVFGLEFNGKHHTLGLSATKMFKLMQDTIRIIRSTEITGRQLSSIVGQWTWASLIRRECLSVFRHVYKFINMSDTKIYTIWTSVKDELRTIMGLAPLMVADLSSKWFNRIMATDASLTGLGVTATRASPVTMSKYARMSPCTTNNGVSLAPILQHPDSDQILYDISDRYKWSTIVSFKWSFLAHINNLELNSVLTCVKWLLSCPASINSRVLLLNDNQSAVYSLSKGRTSAPSIIYPLRRISAHVLASGLRMSYVWIPSTYNPADAPSRAYM
jgi:hypothetical protein